MARIKTVSFRRNVQVREYETIHVEAQVSVGEGEDPKAALEMARDFVTASLVAERKRLLRLGRPDAEG